MKRVATVFCCFVLVATHGCKSRPTSTVLKNEDVKDEKACLFGEPDLVGAGSPGADAVDFLTWKIVKATSLASQLAYQDEQSVRRQAAAWGYPNVDYFQAGTMIGFLMSNDKCAVLSFRGTDFFSLRDWFVNLSAKSLRVRKGFVHGGFYSALNRLKPQVDRAVGNRNVKNKKFWVTGHSLGGALAGLYAYSTSIEPLLFKGPEISKVITFGQPIFTDHVLAAEMRNLFIERYFRVVNETDLVATVPYWLTHFGSLIWMRQTKIQFIPDLHLAGGPAGGGGTNVKPAEIPQELMPTKDSLQEFLDATADMPAGAVMPNQPADTVSFGSRWPKSLADHLMNNYIGRITSEINELGQ